MPDEMPRGDACRLYSARPRAYAALHQAVLEAVPVFTEPDRSDIGGRPDDFLRLTLNDEDPYYEHYGLFEAIVCAVHGDDACFGPAGY